MAAEAYGALALVGSGEYTTAMRATDEALLATLGGPALSSVAVIPTASALEPGQPARWNTQGVAHFQALGAAVSPLLLLSRSDAADRAIVDALHDHNFYYFSGGSPDYITETLEDTPAWEVVRARYRVGAVVAGCSAGAMMLGGYVLSIRAISGGQPPRWRQALGLAPQLAILPHFDRMHHFLDAETWRQVLASAPCGITVVGVDEDTALVRRPGGAHWYVTGRQTVTVFSDGAASQVYPAGADLEL